VLIVYRVHYGADFEKEDQTIMVLVYHNVALVSVLPGWHATCQYNVHELSRLSSAVPVDSSGVPVDSSGDAEWH
jgi:hypothetical protein